MHSNTSIPRVNKNIVNQPTSEDTLNPVDIFKALNERVIAFHPIYARITGSTNAALVLSQLLYWARVMKWREFYKTDEDFRFEIGEGAIGDKAFRAAKDKLQALGFITFKAKGVPAKTHYIIHLSVIMQAVSLCHKASEELSYRPSSPIIGKLDHLKEENQSSSNRKTITETTTEITTEKAKIYVEPARPVAISHEDILVVFRHWQKVMGHPNAKLDDKRKAFIAKALKLYPMEICLKAIDGCWKTPHNMGDNDRGGIYDAVGVIFKNADNIERFARSADSPPVMRLKGEHWRDENAKQNVDFFEGGESFWKTPNSDQRGLK